jgi:hypothetical protein
MNKNTNIRALFNTLHGSLPYEYDEKYVNGVGLEDTIAISKTSSEYAIYITANTPDDNGVFDVTLYDDILDDDPAEITIWDTNGPNLTLIDLIAYIENRL